MPDYVETMSELQREAWEQLAGRFQFEDGMAQEDADYLAYRLVMLDK